MNYTFHNAHTGNFTLKLFFISITAIFVFVLRVLLSSYVYLFILFVFVVPYMYLLYYVCIAVLTLDAGLLARSQYTEGDRPPRHRFFLVSLYLQANAEMVPKF